MYSPEYLKTPHIWVSSIWINNCHLLLIQLEKITHNCVTFWTSTVVFLFVASKHQRMTAELSGGTDVGAGEMTQWFRVCVTILDPCGICTHTCTYSHVHITKVKNKSLKKLVSM